MGKGHFNSIHTGHMRFLEFAKEQGDYFLIAVLGYEQISENNRDKFQDEEIRAKGSAAFQYVDNVIVLSKTNFIDLLEIVKTDVYVRGKNLQRTLKKLN